MISVKKRREIKVFLVTASIGIVVLGGQQVLADAASEMVNPKDKVLVGLLAQLEINKKATM